MGHYRSDFMRRPLRALLAMLALAAVAQIPAAAAEVKKSERAIAPVPLAERLKTLPFKIAWECHVDGNWEIFVMNADGSQPVNLTRTPKVHEHYPQVSPDATKICYHGRLGRGPRHGPQPVGHGYRRQEPPPPCRPRPGTFLGPRQQDHRLPAAGISAAFRRRWTSPPRAWSSITWTAARASRIRIARTCTIFTIRRSRPTENGSPRLCMAAWASATPSS